MSMQNGKEYVYASAETMAKRQNVSKRTAKNRLYELESAGFIEIERRKGKTSMVFITSEKYFTTTSAKNCTTTSEKNCTTSSAKNYTQYNKKNISRVDIKRQQNRIDGNHAASFDSNAYREKAQGEIIYTPKEEPQEENTFDYLPF